MFCVRCGAEGETVDGLCADCWRETNTLMRVPEHVDLEVCTNCGEYMMHNRWERYPTVEDAALDAAAGGIMVRKGAQVIGVIGDVRRQDSRNLEVDLTVTMECSGIEKNEEGSTVVRVKNTVCQRCSRFLGSYYEAILQVRGSERNLAEEDEVMVMGDIRHRVDEASRNDRNNFITKEERVAGGVDVYLSSNSMGKSLSKELRSAYGAEVKESSSLVGKRDGRDMYRVTYLVRLPGYRLGDVIMRDERPYVVSSMGSRVHITSLVDEREENLRPVDLKGVRTVDGTRADAVVVSSSDAELQVLHPRTYETVTLRRPKGLEVGETVAVFLHEDDMYVMPGAS